MPHRSPQWDLPLLQKSVLTPSPLLFSLQVCMRRFRDMAHHKLLEPLMSTVPTMLRRGATMDPNNSPKERPTACPRGWHKGNVCAR